MANTRGKCITEQQRKFVKRYLDTGLLGQSYLDTMNPNMDAKLAASHGRQLLNRPIIKEYVSRISNMNERADIADVEEIFSFWTSIMRDKDNGMQFRLKASEHLAKAKGMFIEKIEHTGNVGIIVEVQEATKKLIEEAKNYIDVDSTPVDNEGDEE